jgi:transcriptional regulator with XRE-family HTH domain
MQLNLPMLTYYVGPRLIDQELVLACKTYREAVRACWDLRTRRHMTQVFLAQAAGLYPSHVSDYLSDADNKRELPARHINAFEVECGNRFVSQWLARQANLTILEQFIDRRAAA